MKSIILVCAVSLHLGGCYGSDDSDGVGAYVYQDSTGQRYEGTYGLRDGQVVNQKGHFPPNFKPPTIPNFDDFFPEYFFNLENILQETFDNIDHQKLAFGAARKAFDLTSNQAGYNQNFAPFRFPFGGDLPGFGGFPNPQEYSGYQGFRNFQMPNFDRSGNSAYAGAAVGPDYSRQTAEINPPNPNNPNINKFSSVNEPAGGYQAVSSSSYVAATNDNGKVSAIRRAETTVDRNGVVTKHVVQS